MRAVANSSPGKKTKTWDIRSNRGDDLLGVIQWYPGWRQYTFQPCSSTVFSRDCLEEIVKMLRRVNAEHTAMKTETPECYSVDPEQFM